MRTPEKISLTCMQTKTLGNQLTPTRSSRICFPNARSPFSSWHAVRRATQFSKMLSDAVIRCTPTSRPGTIYRLVLPYLDRYRALRADVCQTINKTNHFATIDWLVSTKRDSTQCSEAHRALEAQRKGALYNRADIVAILGRRGPRKRPVPVPNKAR
jgi:hypothetical protein